MEHTASSVFHWENVCYAGPMNETAKSVTIQPTQACQVQVGDILQGSLIPMRVSAIESGAFGGLRFTFERCDGFATAAPVVRTYGLTSMVSVVVQESK